VSYESGHSNWADNLQVGDEVIRITSQGGGFGQKIVTGEVCQVMRLTKTIIEVMQGTQIEQYKRTGFSIGSMRSGRGTALLVPFTERNVAEMVTQKAALIDRDARSAALTVIHRFYDTKYDATKWPTSVLTEIAQVIKAQEETREVQAAS
jgi:hypothetical protein